MTNLERRALLGDAEAQRECTEKEILLPCPFCGGRAEKDYILGKIYFGSDDKPSDGYYTYCTGVECPTFGSYSRYYRTEREAILAWNTRPAPPIGRCWECAAYVDNKCMNTGYYKPETGFCDCGHIAFDDDAIGKSVYLSEDDAKAALNGGGENG